MQLCFDATRFGFGLMEALHLAASKNIPSIEFSFDSFAVTAKTAVLSDQEKSYLGEVLDFCKQHQIEVACIRLGAVLDSSDKKSVKAFQQMMKKLAKVCKAIECTRLSFYLKPQPDDGWIAEAGDAINPVLLDLEKNGIKLLLSLSTPDLNRGVSLRRWRPLDPQEWRDLIAACPGLALSFSAADCAWQNIDYLQVLPGIVAAVDHVEANDVEVNRSMLMDSGLFGPLWWRYRLPGKGQIDWKQLIEALKLYDYQGKLSVHLDDEFLGENSADLEDSLDNSVTLLSPLVRY